MICAPEAFAGEGTPGWRKIYDDVMLFVNFGILAFFFIKYAKKPMMKALGGVKGKIAEEFDKVHGKKDEFKSLRDAEALKNKEIEKYTQEIKENILAIFPGSRAREIEKTFPLQWEAAKLWQSRHPDGKVLVSLAKESLKAHIEKISPGVTLVPASETYDLMRRARVSLAKSGTVTFEITATGPTSHRPISLMHLGKVMVFLKGENGIIYNRWGSNVKGSYNLELAVSQKTEVIVIKDRRYTQLRSATYTYTE